MVEAEDEGPAVRALGSLLKLTQVFLWDDGTRNDRSFSLGRTKPAQDEGDDGSNALSSECGTLPEDMELTRQMNELGLPVSFRTNKEKQKRTTQGKRKGMRQKDSNESQEVVGGALDSSKVSVEEIVSPIIFDDNPSSSLCCMSMMGQSESSSSDVAADANYPASSAKITGDSIKEHKRDGIVGIVSNEGQDCDSLHNGAMLTDATTILASSTGLDAVLYPGSCSADAANGHDKTEPGERLMQHDHVECAIMVTSEAEITESCEEHVPEQPCVSESVSCSIYPEGLENGAIDSQQSGDFGDWMVYWDSYYMRNYFYNIRTHTSTWYPPVGMEHLENVDSTYKSNEGVAGVTQMDVTTDLKATDLCGLSKFDSFEEPINVDVLQYQRYEEVSRDVEITAANTLSDTSTSTVSVSICPELPDELNQSNNRCNDGNASCLSSNVQDHIASCRNQTMEQVADEVCNSDLQPIFAGKSAEPDTSDLYDKPNEVYFCEEIPKYGEHDEAIQTLDTSSMSNSCTEEVEDWNMHSETGAPATNELEMKSDPALVKRKKKVRRIRSHRKFFNENEEVLFEGLLEKCSTDIGKYWSQRYLLFSRYDDGIKMDEEGWFSVTPEALAMHHAQRCGSGIIIDCFTGVGGNAIQFAQISKHVTAIDIDPTKIDYAQHNAAIYGVDERIDFIKGDFFHLASRLKADTVFLSPPWGGPGYAREETYDIMTMLKPHDGYFLFNTAKQVASKIVMFLPRNVDVNQLAELSLSGTPPWSLEVEKNFVNDNEQLWRIEGIAFT
ncbi:uncharacterized protein LOC133736263 isoform X2 [Rosa rugosa]|uniref:uncharacterized protein LOC133736263 isoform X2 n=1 Tax=Rosa rugosa TaxID=74645 RepID=UPI002B4102D5|nr:uncharacterized protein LOC133736263 isoform X2 [Rosa rugosa]